MKRYTTHRRASCCPCPQGTSQAKTSILPHYSNYRRGYTQAGVKRYVVCWYISRVLERYEDASALLARAPIDEGGGGHILAGMAHRLIDGDLVVARAPGAAAQQ